VPKDTLSQQSWRLRLARISSEKGGSVNTGPNAMKRRSWLRVRCSEDNIIIQKYKKVICSSYIQPTNTP